MTEEGQDKLSFFKTSGFSMWPFLKSDTGLIVKKVAPEDLKIGDIILYRADNRTVCHRLVRKVAAGDKFALYARGDNSLSSPQMVSEESFLGKAIGILKHGRTINLRGYKRQFMNRLIVMAAPLLRRGGEILMPWYNKLRGLLL